MTTIESLQDAFELIRDETKIGANTAERIGNAFLSLLSYLGNNPYLRTDKVDIDNFLVKLLGGVSIGINGADNAVSGQSGRGILLGQKGDIETDTLLVRGAAMFYELIVNKTQTLEGDTLFSASDIIDTVQITGEKTYRLTLRRMYDGYKTSLSIGDVVFSHVDNLLGDGTYHTCWFRVDKVNTDDNEINVTLFSGSMCPAGVNFAPEPGAKVAQRGNVSDTSRQSVWYLSSTEKGLFFYVGVTKPIIDESNIYLFAGIPPKNMSVLAGEPINYDHPYIYCRGLIAQDIIRIDYKGNPVYTIRDLGLWKDDIQYIRGLDATDKTYYQDQTWHGGCAWRCVTDKATIGLEPRYNNTEWVCITGANSYTVDINSSAGTFFRVGTAVMTTLTATVKHAEMVLLETEITRACITWTRTSDSGSGDAAWNALHAAGTCGLSIDITDDDMPSDWLTSRHVSFTITISLPSVNKTVTDSYTIAK